MSPGVVATVSCLRGEVSVPVVAAKSSYLEGKVVVGRVEASRSWLVEMVVIAREAREGKEQKPNLSARTSPHSAIGNRYQESR